MIKCNHYSLDSGVEFLLYGEDLSIPEFLKLKLITEDIDPSKEPYCNLPIFNYNMFLLSTLRKQNRDKVLEGEHIESFFDLAQAYFLIKIKKLNKSKRVRDFVKEKYIEVIELIKNDNEQTSTSNTDGSRVDYGGSET